MPAPRRRRTTGNSNKDLALRVEIRSRPDGLAVACHADLPDGAVVQVGLWRGDWDGPFVDVRRTAATVEGGACEVVFVGTGDWIGQVSAALELHADRSQPANVQRVIGRTGQRLAYSDLDGGDSKHVYVTTTIDVRAPGN